MSENTALTRDGNDLVNTISPELFTQDMTIAKYPISLVLVGERFKIKSLHGSDFIKSTSVKEIDLRENELEDLDGIGHFQTLRKLVCSSNRLTRINTINDSLPLSKCSRIIHIDLSDNQITIFPDFSELSNLQTLNLNSNKISSLEEGNGWKKLQECSKLTNLSIGYNQLNIDENNYQVLESTLNSLTRLSVLELQGNTFWDKNSSEIRAYFISRYPKLTMLSNEKITPVERTSNISRNRTGSWPNASSSQSGNEKKSSSSSSSSSSKEYSDNSEKDHKTQTNLETKKPLSLKRTILEDSNENLSNETLSNSGNGSGRSSILHKRQY